MNRVFSLTAVRTSSLFTFLAVTPLVVLAQLPREWTQVEGFSATGLHGWGNTVVAWNERQVSVSRDGGLSWSPPILPPGSAETGLHQAMASRNGVTLLLADGRMMPGTATANRLAVDGSGQLYFQTFKGEIMAFQQEGEHPKIIGTLLTSLAEGVLIRPNQGGLAVLRSTGVEALAAQSVDNLPRFFALASLTGGGSNWIMEREGRSFVLQRRRISLRSERPVRILSHWEEQGVRYELISYEKQLQILEYRRVERLHPASRDLPEDTILLAGSTQLFVAVTPQGIWVRTRE